VFFVVYFLFLRSSIPLLLNIQLVQLNLFIELLLLLDEPSTFSFQQLEFDSGDDYECEVDH
jgi:hypothetical protein